MGIETALAASAGASLIGGYLQSKAAKDAAYEQSQATGRGIDEQGRQFDIARADQRPFLETGQAATIKLRDLLGLNGGSGTLLRSFSPADLESEPGYQFGLNQGNKAIENAARARGVYMSPSTMKELLRYGQDYAGTKYMDAFNRDLSNRTTTYNMLSGAGSRGQVAANTLANAGGNYATNVGNLLTAGANARGAAGIVSANAWGNAFNNVGNSYLQGSYLNRILNDGGGNGGGVYRPTLAPESYMG